MSQLPPYGLPPGGPPPPRTGLSNAAKFWLGALIAIPAVPVAGFVLSLPSTLAAAAGLDGVTGVLSLVAGLLELAGLVALIAFPRTRWWGLGLLAGIALLAILAAGACVVLLVALTQAG